MKLSRCRGCKKFIDKDPFGQPEMWKCLACAGEVCVWCFGKHSQSHLHDFYPQLHNEDGTLKNG